MALNPTVETWATKQAQIKKKQLEIEDLQQQMSADIVPHQTSITDIQADYNGQIAAKQSEISQLEADIRALAI